MPSVGDVSAGICQALGISEPDLDTSVGTPVRKIIDAVSESVAEAYADSHLIDFQYDIDSKSGGDLESFCVLFGISRLPAQRAQGVVTFTRPDDEHAKKTATIVPVGTQVAALVDPVIYVQTTLAQILDPGVLVMDVPVQAVDAGPTGNVPAGVLTAIASSVSGVSRCTNQAALYGGTPQESDEQLRTRFKATVFRSLAGTEAMYQAVTQAVPADPNFPTAYAVSQTNVLGATKRRREQIQLVSGSATVDIADAAYIYSDGVFCGSDIDAGDILTAGVGYSFAVTNPVGNGSAKATLLSLSDSTMPDGLYDLDFEFVPQSSRNDPVGSRFGQGRVDNRIDVWCNGTVSTQATQSVVFSTATRFSATTSDPFYTGLYEVSDAQESSPSEGTIFLPLGYGPILGLPTTISAGGTVYHYQSDYWIVERNDCFGRAVQSACGVAWTADTSRHPPEGTVFPLTYPYNAVPSLVSGALAQWRLLGTDSWTHAGRTVLLRFHLAVVYDRRFGADAVATDIDQVLGELCDRLGFDATLRVADVLSTVADIPGVANVRLLRSSDDADDYAIQSISPYLAETVLMTYSQNGHATDVSFPDDTYPVFDSTRIVVKAHNTFEQGT